MVDTGKLKQWVELRRKQFLLEEQLKDIKEDAETLAFLLIDQFASDGIETMKVDGVSVYVQEKLQASLAYLPNETTDQGYDRACDVLERIGLNELVHRRFLVPSLTKWVNDNKESLPAEFQGVIRVDTKHVLVPRGVKTKNIHDLMNREADEGLRPVEEISADSDTGL